MTSTNAICRQSIQVSSDDEKIRALLFHPGDRFIITSLDHSFPAILLQQLLKTTIKLVIVGYAISVEGEIVLDTLAEGDGEEFRWLIPQDLLVNHCTLVKRSELRFLDIED